MAEDRQALLAQAARMREAEINDVAAGLYQRVLALAPEDPDNAPVYEMLGDVLQKQGRAAEAITAYQKAVEMSPTDARRSKLGAILSRLEGVPADVPSAPPAAGKAPSLTLPKVSLPTNLAVDGASYEKFREYASIPAHAKIIIRVSIAVLAIFLLLLIAPWKWFTKHSDVVPGHTPQPATTTHVFRTH